MLTVTSPASIDTVPIDEARIGHLLEITRGVDKQHVHDILAKARQLEGLDESDVAALATIDDPELLEALYETGSYIKDEIYGSRLVLFAPLYVSNYCANECSYCAFRCRNKLIKRRALSQGEIAREVTALIDQGHKRLLLVAGESYPKDEGFDYILNSIHTIYATKKGKGEIRRLNVNIAPLTVDQFRRLKATEIGTYQIFQETYHRETYRKVHTVGKKMDYDWRISAPSRAMMAGIDDVGIGPLFGLYDWKFEVLALLQHIRFLEDRFNCGPHTISMPRIEPATGSELADAPPYRVSNTDFKKIIAILRLTVPYTGMILSTRENMEMRRHAFAMGISQISAGSRCNPGGYSELGDENATTAKDGQFQLGDHRDLDEVVRDCAELGYIPSFCTACYRVGRTGEDFMDLAKPRIIKFHCGPNALASFYEYLIDYASVETRAAGEKLIGNILDGMDKQTRGNSENLIKMLREGKRDVFV
ncbi:MAG TPA: [FeFe] hydrogenase H-cluster radical SAM maturase HydG [Tepidisphaeraceae bacterium]|nr:[FeFe] hydrogenase H-cluster radical SAM maturase HydG [Tepidisphaeraceae bacterium]